jgi:hypothetical protein
MNTGSENDNPSGNLAPVSLPAVILDSEKLEKLSPAHNAVLQTLLSDLSIKTPEQVIAGLIETRTIPPEVATLISEGLLETFIQVRRLMLVANTTPKLAKTMSTTATQILVEYFRSVSQLVERAVSLSGDAMRNVEILSIVLSAKDLSAIPQDQLYQGLRGVDAFRISVERIVTELISRIADGLRTEGIQISPKQIECSSDQSTFKIALPFQGTFDEAQSVVARFKKAIQPSFTAFQAKFTPFYQAKPTQYMGEGEMEFTFQFWEGKSESNKKS